MILYNVEREKPDTETHLTLPNCVMSQDRPEGPTVTEKGPFQGVVLRGPWWGFWGAAPVPLPDPRVLMDVFT